MTDEHAWWGALIFGVFMVFLYSWPRFDEATGNAKANYFLTYKPSFHTSRFNFLYARFAYLALVIAVYLGLCFAPQLLAYVSAETAEMQHAAIPLAIAVSITSLQNIVVIKDFEWRLRGFLHSVAKIPHAVHRTVAHMRSAEFDFSRHADQMSLQKIAEQLPLAEFDQHNAATEANLYNEDDLIRPWWRVACLLQALEPRNRANLQIDPLFFEEYKDELESIQAHHAAHLYDVSLYMRDVIAAAKGGARRVQVDAAMIEDVRKVRDRLYIFIACGLLSTVSSREVVRENLQRLGFEFAQHARPAYPFWHITGFSLVAIVIATFVSTGATKLFLGLLPTPDELDWRQLLHIPQSDFGLVTWSWKSAIFYFSIILATIAARQSYIAKRRWFDIRSTDRNKPVLQYVGPSLFGTLTGWFVLSIIIFSTRFIGPTGFEPQGEILTVTQAILEAIKGSSHWVVLAMTIAFGTLYAADSDLRSDSPLKLAERSLTSGLIAGLVSYAIFMFLAAEASAPAAPPEPVAAARSYFTIINSFFIALLVAMLFWVFQFVERAHLRAQDFSDKTLSVRNSRGLQFLIRLAADGSATSYVPEKEPGQEPSEAQEGKWKQIPEGTAICWNGESGSEKELWGTTGLISVEADAAIYEGYLNGGSMRGGADFVGQIEVQH